MFGLGLLKGLYVTMRHFVESFVYDRKPWEPRISPEGPPAASPSTARGCSPSSTRKKG